MRYPHVCLGLRRKWELLPVVRIPVLEHFTPDIEEQCVIHWVVIVLSIEREHRVGSAENIATAASYSQTQVDAVRAGTKVLSEATALGKRRLGNGYASGPHARYLSCAGKRPGETVCIVREPGQRIFERFVLRWPEDETSTLNTSST
jgi:hypothetical protein